MSKESFDAYWQERNAMAERMVDDVRSKKTDMVTIAAVQRMLLEELTREDPLAARCLDYTSSILTHEDTKFFEDLRRGGINNVANSYLVLHGERFSKTIYGMLAEIGA